MNENKLKQAEEIEALSSIYGNDFKMESERSFNIKIEDNKKQVLLSVLMPQEYPMEASPKYELSAPWMERNAKERLHKLIDEVCLENNGETVIFQWVEKIREFLQLMKSSEPKGSAIEETLDLAKLEISCPEITNGQIIKDRKSIFQGHAARVHSLEDVNAVLAKLKQNKKILHATHNMYAYRIERQTDKGTIIMQDCENDGEAHAGSRMLHLLRILEQKNTLVVVSRWYGGIQLGSDRFRHINNACKQVIEQAGLLNNTHQCRCQEKR